MLYPLSWYNLFIKTIDIDKIFEISLKSIIVSRLLGAFSTITSILKVAYKDVMVAFFFHNSDIIEGEEICEQHFQFQKNFFKYKKPKYLNLKFIGTEEEFLKLQKDTKYNRNPRKPINIVRRLP
jgi:hypothetical protein